ncbi:MAG TPA: hypothetical protein VH393_05505, partial [Ktedonobacterales bacterium]
NHYVQETAAEGDVDALRVLFRSMLADPERGAKMIDLTTRVRKELVKASFGEGNDASAREMFVARCAIVEAGLLTEARGLPLERLLIERIVTCWLAVELAEADSSHWEAQRLHNLPAQLKIGEYMAHRRDQAHKRFLSAVAALAQMRRLLSPIPLMAGQVNIAQQQTNIVNEGNR